MLLLVALLLAPIRAQGDATPAVEDSGARSIIAQLIEHNSSLQTYEGADVHVHVAMRSFPYLHLKLVGKTYFKRRRRRAVASTSTSRGPART